MWLFKGGRKYLLDLINNIPNHALLFTIGLLYLHGGLRKHPTATTTAIAIVFCLIGLLAVYASLSSFLELMYEELVGPAKQRARELFPDHARERTKRQQWVARAWASRYAYLETCAITLLFTFVLVATVTAAWLAVMSAIST